MKEVMAYPTSTEKQYPTFFGIIKAINLRLNQILFTFAGVSLVASMLLVVLNALVRTFTDPLPGTVEVVGWLTAIATAFAVGNTQINKAHVYIDLLFNKFSMLWRKIVFTVVMLMSCIFFSVLTWQLLKYGLDLQAKGIVSETLRLPLYPLVILVSIGFMGMVSSVFVQCMEVFFEEEGHGC